MLVNSADFAASQGFSKQYVTTLVKRGVITRDKKGMIDPEAAAAALEAQRNPSKPLRRRGRVGKPPLNISDSPGGGSSNGSLAVLMLKSRIKTEVERGRIAELDRKEREGELVDRRKVEEAHFTQARNLRDAILNVPSRVSTLFAAETDPQRIHQDLEDELRRVLLDFIEKEEVNAQNQA